MTSAPAPPLDLFVRSSMLRAALVAAVMALAGAGCTDPCVALAERICNCEPTSSDRLACQRERVTNVQSSVQIDDDDRSACTAALDTCSCAAIDENKLDLCGFAPPASAAAARGE